MFHERGTDLDGEDDVRGAYEERRGPYCGVEMAEQPALRSVVIPAILSNCRSLADMKGNRPKFGQTERLNLRTIKRNVL